MLRTDHFATEITHLDRGTQDTDPCDSKKGYIETTGHLPYLEKPRASYKRCCFWQLASKE